LRGWNRQDARTPVGFSGSGSNFLVGLPIIPLVKGYRTPTAVFEEPDPELDGYASDVVHACREVHQVLGPGYLESVYDKAVCIELQLRGVEFERQVPVRLWYKGASVGEHRFDLLIRRRLIVELKAVESLSPVHLVQVRSYLKARGERLGLLVNFNVPLLLQGVRRVILPQ